MSLLFYSMKITANLISYDSAVPKVSSHNNAGCYYISLDFIQCFFNSRISLTWQKEKDGTVDSIANTFQDIQSEGVGGG